MRFIRVGLEHLRRRRSECFGSRRCVGRNGWWGVSAAPNRHVIHIVRFGHVASINRFINRSQWKYTVVLLGDGGQVGRFCLELGSAWTYSLPICTMAVCATRQILRLPSIDVFRPTISTERDYHGGSNYQRIGSCFFHARLGRKSYWNDMSFRPIIALAQAREQSLSSVNCETNRSPPLPHLGLSPISPR
jgi:hypothetical protein